MMRIAAIFGGWLFALVATLGGAAPSHAAGPPLGDPVTARLAAETGSVAPGQTVWVALRLDIAPGWHVYWRNPGDAGLPTEIAWDLPDGFAAGDIVWPVPERFVVGGIGGYGYGEPTDLLVPVTAPTELRTGDSAHLAATASWLACSEICIPGEARLALDLPVSAAPAAPDPAAAPLFAAARARLPQPAGFETRFVLSATELRLLVPEAALSDSAPPAVSFFPITANLVDPAAEPRQRRHAGGVDLVMTRPSGPAALAPEAPPDVLDGVLAVRGADGSGHAYLITASPLAAAPALAAGLAEIGWWQALLLAFAGGIILNLMPCVFPVLSLKLLGLAASAHRAEERRHALAYAAGVILSFALLGGVLLMLRAGGAAIGWGFQLQSPIVVALLAYLLFALGLSLSGVAEFGLGLGNVGGRAAGRPGLGGAFATGVLATIVATPCTAPFMGAALGFAVFAPAPQALAIFAVLGAGLAAPILLATAIPGLARMLPRPGPWMVWFKQLLAFPLYATVAWLIWVLIQSVAPGNAFLALLGLVFVGFAMWIYGRTCAAESTGRRLGLGLAATGCAAALAIAATLAPAAGPSGVAAAPSGGLAYEPFSTSRLSSLAADGRPAFVNLTAAWCITCLVNEHTALDSAAVRRAFAERGIVALKGDWTRQDPEITAFLQTFGRSGVPLYLLYDQSGRATILPQILTEAGVLAAVDRI